MLKSRVANPKTSYAKYIKIKYENVRYARQGTNPVIRFNRVGSFPFYFGNSVPRAVIHCGFRRHSWFNLLPPRCLSEFWTL